MHNEITLDISNTQSLLQTSRVSGAVPDLRFPCAARREPPSFRVALSFHQGLVGWMTDHVQLLLVNWREWMGGVDEGSQ